MRIEVALISVVCVKGPCMGELTLLANFASVAPRQEAAHERTEAIPTQSVFFHS